jgi:SAM-dependent methyltransferase
MEDKSVAVDVGLRDAVLSGWYQAQTGELFQGLAISAADTVLDVGCGDGGSAHFCASRGASMIVTDVDATKVEATKRLLASIPAREIRAMVSDSNPLPLEDGAASVVISTEVLEHVDDPARVTCSPCPIRSARRCKSIWRIRAILRSPIMFGSSSAKNSQSSSAPPVW